MASEVRRVTKAGYKMSLSKLKSGKMWRCKLNANVRFNFVTRFCNPMPCFWLTNGNNAKQGNARKAFIHAAWQRTETYYDKLKNALLAV